MSQVKLMLLVIAITAIFGLGITAAAIYKPDAMRNLVEPKHAPVGYLTRQDENLALLWHLTQAPKLSGAKQP